MTKLAREHLIRSSPAIAIAHEQHRHSVAVGRLEPSRIRTITLVCSLMLAAGCSKTPACDGLWSRFELKLDGDQEVLANGYWVEARNGEIHLRSEFEPSVWLLGTVGLTGVISDAKRERLLVSTSDGGWVGTWQPELFTLSVPPKNLVLPTQAIEELDTLGECERPSFPNVAGLAFLPDGIALLAQAPMSSVCRKMGEGVGVELDSKGAFRRTLSSSQVVSEWGEWFGCRPAMGEAESPRTDEDSAPSDVPVGRLNQGEPPSG